jgi:transcriptional regulator with XRE-family HTH domain
MRLSLYRAAKLMNISHSSLFRIEEGEVIQPTPQALTSIAKVLCIPLADLFAAAGYVTPAELPSVRPYFRARYSDLPEAAVRDLERYAESLAKKHGVSLNGPAHGEDESDEPPTEPK